MEGLILAMFIVVSSAQRDLMVEDFETLDGWQTRGEEISIDLDGSHVRTGQRCLHIHLEVNHDNGMGWPAATKTYENPIDLSDFQFVEFDIYFESERGRDPDFAMHVTLKDDQGREIYRTTLIDLRHRRWSHERFCIAGIPGAARLSTLHLWFSEDTYDHGDIIDIYVDNFRATEAPPRPELPSFDLPPTRGLLASSPAAKVWLAEPVEKVLRKTPIPTAHLQGLILSGARNEYLSAQLVLTPQTERGIGTVRLTFTDLRGSSGDVIHADNIWWSQVVYVPAREGPPEGLPDALPGPEPFTADRPWNYPIWLDFYVPPDAKPGRYMGSLTIDCSAAGHFTIPITLKVYDFSVPRRQSVPFVTHLYGPWGWSEEIKRWFGDMSYRDYVRRWRPKIFALLARYRMSPLTLASMEMRWDGKSGRAVITNADEFLRLTNYYLSLGCGMYGVGVPFFFNRDAFLGAKKGTPEYLKRITAAYETAAEFLREENLPTHWEVYCVDEVVVHKHSRPIDFDLLNSVFDAIHAGDPAIKIFATEVPSPLIHTRSKITWCMNVSSLDEDVLREEKSKGREVWWYNGYRLPRPAAHISAPGIAHRAMFWIMYKYDIDGYFIWTVNRWTSNPWERPNRSRRAKAGQHYWLYPNPDGTVSPSLRLAMFRDGAEDYEYMVALERLANRLEKRGKQAAADHCREALRIALSIVLAYDNAVCINYDQLRRARELLARTLQVYNPRT
ncbi:DUF4091 domain-containing protein [Candidatus Poribacteria bacterium]|nr:DUF4091 domain-containing protein [Candidatus Poribacteria bacterium]